MKQNPAKNNATWLITIFFFFFIQQTTFLVESVYMLDLLHTRLDAKALGVLFFYSPLFLLFAKRSVGKKMCLSIGLLFLLCSLLTPWMSTSIRIVTSGVAVGSFLLFIGIFVPRWQSAHVHWIGVLAAATMATITFKVLGASLDLSATGPTRIIGLVLGVIAFFVLMKTITTNSAASPGNYQHTETASSASHYLAALGLASCIILLYFAFASPIVVTRWTEVSMQGVHIVLMLSILLLLALASFRPRVIVQLRKHHLVLWNILFMSFLFEIIRLHSISLPATPDSSPVVVAVTSGYFNIFTYIMLSLSPIIFLNASVFIKKLQMLHPYQWAGPLSVAGLFFSMLIFMLIFTNVWGYVGKLSLFFRNKFYLPFLLACLGMVVPIFFLKKISSHSSEAASAKGLFAAATLFSLLVFGYLATTGRPRPAIPSSAKELTVMTFNIQQGVDYVGNKNYRNQLKVIRRVNPDVLCLQESDVARISGGNSDVVGYFSQKLNYFSYYGPKTVTGTFGTAILSRFPLLQCKSIFTYSDSDEIGTAFAEILFAGKIIAIFSNHPAGSKAAKQAHIDMLIREAKKYEYVLAMGDFNFTQQSPYYQKIAALLVDSWLAVWPNAVGDMRTVGMKKGKFDPKSANGVWKDDFHLDMSDRIDHIFVSHNFQVIKSAYLPVPLSQSDHPADWTVLKIR